MILLNLNKPAPELICPHCERPMSEHGGVKECGRARVSRRFFMGGLGLAAAGTAAGLAFTQRAQAALQDAVPVKSVPTEHALSGIFDHPPLRLVEEFAPKVHRGGPIIITHAGDGWYGKRTGQPQMSETDLQRIADKEGREVIFKSEGTVRVAKPSNAEWEKKWTAPSLAHYDGNSESKPNLSVNRIPEFIKQVTADQRKK